MSQDYPCERLRQLTYLMITHSSVNLLEGPDVCPGVAFVQVKVAFALRLDSLVKVSVLKSVTVFDPFLKSCSHQIGLSLEAP